MLSLLDFYIELCLGQFHRYSLSLSLFSFFISIYLSLSTSIYLLHHAGLRGPPTLLHWALPRPVPQVLSLSLSLFFLYLYLSIFIYIYLSTSPCWSSGASHSSTWSSASAGSTGTLSLSLSRIISVCLCLSLSLSLSFSVSFSLSLFLCFSLSLFPSSFFFYPSPFLSWFLFHLPQKGMLVNDKCLIIVCIKVWLPNLVEEDLSYAKGNRLFLGTLRDATHLKLYCLLLFFKRR